MEEYINKNDFADFVKFMRESINLSKREFADAIGVTDYTVYNWEFAKSMPKKVHAVIKNIRETVKFRIKENRRNKAYLVKQEVKKPRMETSERIKIYKRLMEEGIDKDRIALRLGMKNHKSLAVWASTMRKQGLL